MFCLSSLSLAYTLCAMCGALWVYLNPRTGDSYSSLPAMLHFSFFYGVLCLPVLFYDDGRGHGDAGFPNDIDRECFLGLSRLVAFITFPAFAYFLIDAAPHFREFLGGGIDRESFRAGVELSHFESPMTAVFALCGTFSTLAAFLGMVILLLYPGRTCLAILLLCGGFTYAVNMLKHAGRSGMVEGVLFCFSVGCVFWSKVESGMRRKLKVFAAGLLLIMMIPFSLITQKRFGAENDDRGVLYSLISYFATGPYGYNADFSVETEYGLPRGNGVITCFFFPFLIDLAAGSELTQKGQEAVDYIANGTDEHYMVSGAFSGEFKTILGTFLLDYGLVAASGIVLVFSAVYFFIFRSRKRSLSYYVLSSVYFYTLFLGPIGFGFGTRYRNLMLLNLLVFSALVQYVSKRRCC